MGRKKDDCLLRAPVEFGTVSIGKGSASVPCKFERDFFTLQRAEELLCGRRLNASIATGQDGEEQPKLFEDLETTVAAIFEVKGFSVKPDHLKATLNVQLAEIDVELLSHFANRKGQVKIDGAEAIEEASGEEAPADAA